MPHSKLLTQAEAARRLDVCEPRLRKLLSHYHVEPDYTAAGNKLRLYSEATVDGLRRYVQPPEMQRETRAAKRRFLEQTTEAAR